MHFFCCRLLEMAKQEVGMTGALAEKYEHSKEGGGGGGDLRNKKTSPD